MEVNTLDIIEKLLLVSALVLGTLNVMLSVCLHLSLDEEVGPKLRQGIYLAYNALVIGAHLILAGLFFAAIKLGTSAELFNSVVGWASCLKLSLIVAATNFVVMAMTEIVYIVKVRT